MRDRIVRTTIAALASLGLAVFTGAPAIAGAQVTRGTLHPFAAALTDPTLSAYRGLSGHAQMVRTADGKTLVSVHAAGLL